MRHNYLIDGAKVSDWWGLTKWPDQAWLRTREAWERDWCMSCRFPMNAECCFFISWLIIKCNLTLAVSQPCDLHLWHVLYFILGTLDLNRVSNANYLLQFSRYEFNSNLNFCPRRTDRQTQSDAYEPTVQVAQVGSIRCHLREIMQIRLFPWDDILLSNWYKDSIQHSFFKVTEI